MEYTIDAKNKKIGRVATAAAVLLMGKNRTDFVRNAIPAVQVKVENASKLSISEKKLQSKFYKRFSGYPGGLKEESMKKVIEEKGNKEILRKAIYGMLPHNSLRPRMMKNLIIEE